MTHLSPRSGVELLFVDVPEGIRVTLVDNEYRVILLSDKTIIDLTVSGQWELLGRANEITEGICMNLIEIVKLPLMISYRDYEEGSICVTAKMSWQSFLRFHKIEGSAVVLRKVL